LGATGWQTFGTCRFEYAATRVRAQRTGAPKGRVGFGRPQLRSGALQKLTAAPPPAPQARESSPALQHYASLFNAHDWDGVRALLADDVRLDLVSRRKVAGRRDVEAYFINYERATDWRLSAAWVDGNEVLAVHPDAAASPPRYFVELSWRDGRVFTIHDFRYVTYIAQDTSSEFPSPTHSTRPP
jgi:hypothetical protein